MNPFATRSPNLSGPATDALPVTPDDATDLPHVAIGLYVEGAGTLAVVTAAGATRSLSVPAHAILPLGVARVLATGTSATGIHALVLA